MILNTNDNCNCDKCDCTNCENCDCRECDCCSKNADYSVHYSEDSFWDKVKKFALIAGIQVIEKAAILYYTLNDSDTPAKSKAIIISALGYLICPIDAIPDITPVIGFVDDLGVLAMAFGTVAANIKEEHVQKAKELLKRLFGDDDKGLDGDGSTAPA